MWRRGTPCPADTRNDLPGLHPFSLPHKVALVMRISRKLVMTMTQDNQVSVSGQAIVRIDNLTGSGSVNRRSLGGCNINTIMHAPSAMSEAAADFSPDGPLQPHK